MAICAWCKKDLGGLDGSHGICEPCGKKLLGQMENPPTEKSGKREKKGRETS